MASLAVALTPDGQLAVSASQDKTLKVWELDSGRELRTLDGHTSAVQWRGGDAGRPAGGLGFWDRTLKVWELGSGRELRTLRGHTDWVNAVAVTPDGTRVASAS